MTQPTNLQRAKEVDNFLKDFKEMLCHNGIWDEERYKYYEAALDEIVTSTYIQAVEDCDAILSQSYLITNGYKDTDTVRTAMYIENESFNIAINKRLDFFREQFESLKQTKD